MPTLNEIFKNAEQCFVTSISEALRNNQITRDDAQKLVAYHISGAWNKLDPVVAGLPIIIRKGTR